MTRHSPPFKAALSGRKRGHGTTPHPWAFMARGAREPQAPLTSRRGTCSPQPFCTHLSLVPEVKQVCCCYLWKGPRVSHRGGNRAVGGEVAVSLRGGAAGSLRTTHAHTHTHVHTHTCTDSHGAGSHPGPGCYLDPWPLIPATFDPPLSCFPVTLSLHLREIEGLGWANGGCCRQG